ncbi:MAG: glycosyltransferase, partial [Actinomycetota bacterium]|nr:glycosyltransferase [Actinomycetota bacterium]
MSEETRPRFTLVVTDSGPGGLSATLASVAAQTHPPADVEVLTSEGADLPTARNEGLPRARGSWVSFPEAGDTLAPGYLARIADFLDEHPEADLVAATRLVHDGEEHRNTHPLRYMFRDDPYVDLGADGQHFIAAASSAFFRLDRVRELDLAFDDRVQPVFGDDHFAIRYLLGTERPRVGFLGSARYRTTEPAEAADRSDLRRGTAALEHGLLDVVRRATARGKLPSWLQSHLVFALADLVTLTDSQTPVGIPTGGPDADRFHAMVREILAAVDVDEAVPYLLAPIHRHARMLLQHGFRDEPWHEPAVLLGPLDQQRRMVQASWYFTGDAAIEELRSAGLPVAPLHAKTRAFV